MSGCDLSVRAFAPEHGHKRGSDRRRDDGPAAVAECRTRFSTGAWITDADQIELPDDNGTFDFSEVDLRANILADEGGKAYIEIPVHLYGATVVNGSLQQL